MNEVQKFLQSNDVAKLEEDPYNIRIKQDGERFLFSYHPYDSDLTLPLVQQCRGLILDRSEGWSIVSPGFPKFFNIGDSEHASDIDWDTACIQEKVDGTCVILNDNGSGWGAHTLGTFDASGRVPLPGADTGSISYCHLFFDTFEELYGLEKLDALDPDRSYVFELCTPLNQIVKQYDRRRIVLVSIRDRDTLQELPVHEHAPSFVEVPFEIPVQDKERVFEHLDTLDPDDEGFVVVDSQFRRLKVKQESYLKRHDMRDHLVSGEKTDFLNVVHEDLQDELIEFFPHSKEKIQAAEEAYHAAVRNLERIFREVRGPETDPKDGESRKRFALSLHDHDDVCRASVCLFFQVLDGQNDTFLDAMQDSRDSSQVHAIVSHLRKQGRL